MNKVFADVTNIKVLDFEKYDSYTQRGRYVVAINGERKLSGNSEIEALTKTLAMTNEYLIEYRTKYQELCRLCSPIVNHIRPIESENDYE